MYNLFIYEHCPFCVKAQMAFGLTSTPFIKNIIMEGDIQTPTQMIGKKMVPILKKPDGSYMGESGDIVNYIYQHTSHPRPKKSQHKALLAWPAKAWKPALALIVPRTSDADYPELGTPYARESNKQRHERVFGDFNLLKKKTSDYISQLNPLLKELNLLLIERTSANQKDEIEDIDYEIYPLLRSLTIVKEVTFPPNVLRYMKNLEKRTGVYLHI